MWAYIHCGTDGTKDLRQHDEIADRKGARLGLQIPPALRLRRPVLRSHLLRPHVSLGSCQMFCVICPSVSTSN